MAQSIDDILDHPVIQNTLEQILGRPLAPEASEVLNKRSTEGVPYSLQANPEETTQEDEVDDNPVPESLRANEEEENEPPASLKANEAPPSEDKDTEEEEATSAKQSSVPQQPTEETTPTPQASGPELASMLNFGSPQQNQSGLEAALAERRRELGQAQMLRGSELLSAGLRRGTPINSGSEELYKQANLPIEEYMMRQKDEATNPKSGLSQGLRDYVKKLGVNVSDGATAAQIQSVLPMVYKDIEAKQSAQSKKEQLEERLSERKDEAQYRNKLLGLKQQELSANKTQASQDKLAKQNDANAFKVGAQLESVRGDKALQNAKESIRRVASANQILAHYPNLNDVPPQVASAITTDLGTIIQGGQLGEAGYQELATPTLYSRLAKGAQQVLNKPTGANLGAFLQQNQQLLNELKGTAEEQVNDKYRRVLNTQGKILSPKDRENYRMQYLPQDKADDNGMYQGTQAAHGLTTPSSVPATIFDPGKAAAELKRRQAGQ